jgi:Xaa-Pro aminopeptidase
MSDKEIEHALEKVKLEEELAESRRAVSRAHAMLRNVATDLEDGRDPLVVADDIHEALGEGRTNGTEDDSQ